MKSTQLGDQHLSGFSNALLLAGATATILLFYFFVLGSIVGLVVALLLELVILLALARFGMAGIFVSIMQRHGVLLSIFIRSLRLGKNTGFRISLRAAEVPELTALLKKICQQAKVPMPNKVFLQMGVNAWVQMKGYRAGAGQTILGIGYDLLAGLSQTEFEGVLAHEMMHAKLVQRGFRQLLTGGIGRAAQLTNGLNAQVAQGVRVKRESMVTRFFARCADRLTRMAARQVAACSRQDEFAADRGAAELCGAGAICSSLRKLEGLNRIAARLPLRERIAQLESGEGFGQWLVKELAAAPAFKEDESREQAFNKYSTHPSLHDRLAALSAFPDQTVADSPPALGLLADPDQVAEKLVTAIQKEVIEQEQKDSKQLDRWNRKGRGTRQLQPLQVLGFFAVIVSLIGGGLTWGAQGFSVALAVVTVLIVAVGFTLTKIGGYREKLALPVPEYSLIKTTSQKKLEVKDEQVKAIEAELAIGAAEGRNPKKKSAILVGESYKALAQCDYVRAHVAARLSLQKQPKSVPGTLALAVAAGGLKLGQQVGQAVHFVRAHTGMKGTSTAWGAGWGLALVGDWIHAEAFLEQARAMQPKIPTIWALLAISQARRGKLFTAIASARKACSLRPDGLEYTKLLIDLLLQGGFLRESTALLQPLVNEAVTDTELTLAMVRLCFLKHDEDVAEQWIEFVRQSPEGPKKFVTLGEACEAARKDDKAAEHFQQALSGGHYPEALLGLGRVEANRQNKTQAGTYFLAALDLLRPLGENSVGPIPLVLPILQQLKLLQEPILNCQGYIAALPRDITPPALAGITFLIYAPSGDDAKRSLETVLNAMRPGAPPPPTISWKVAPKEQQPDGPVYPGIQAVLN